MIFLVTVLIIFGSLFFQAYKIYMNFDDNLKIESNQKWSTVEKNSLYNEDELKNYLIFTELPPIEKSHIIRVPPLVKNKCTKTNCYKSEATLKDFPPGLWKNLLKVEDKRFLIHQGLDFKAILRAMIVNLKDLSYSQGASTLTQQLIKNKFLSNEKTLKRKFIELIAAFLIEIKFSKEKILTSYLNEVYWGALQKVHLYGARSATLFYFQKKLDEINEFESLILVCLLKGPGYFSPLKSLDKLKNRVHYFAKDLKIKSWSNQEWKAWVETLKKLEETTPYKSLVSLSKYKKSNYKQYVLMESVSKVLDGLPVISLFSILSIKNGSYTQWGKQGSFWNKNAKYLHSRTQLGSLIKPLLYNYFISKGKKHSTLVNSSPYIYKNWHPKDHIKKGLKKLTLADSLKKSYNWPFLHISKELGFEGLEKYLIQNYPMIPLKRPLGEYQSQLLGAIDMSIKDISYMYLKWLEMLCEEGHIEIADLISFKNKTTYSHYITKKLKDFSVFGKTGTTNEGKNNWFVGIDGNEIVTILTRFNGNTALKYKTSGASTSFRIYQRFLMSRGKSIEILFCPR